MEIVGVDAEESSGVGNATVGLVEGGENELFFEVADGVVVFSGWATSGFGCFQNALGEILR